MKKVYHGAKSDLKLENKVSPRYGLKVLFFTDELRLAKLYAKSDSYVYEASIKPDETIDFKGNISHSSEFRNLIFKLSRKGVNVVAIKNVNDRPNDSFPFELSTIYVVFDFDKIKSLQPYFNNSDDAHERARPFGIPNQ